mmetsp:Transcript_27325/g.63451  ORF Transcript_27325/g.63451 Transcript_27325/m.63451 type:complete len:179 (+) Transcript_27325:232-768(+)
MLIVCDFFCAVAVGIQIVVAGANNRGQGSTSAEIYDTETGMWSSFPSLGIQRGYCASILVGKEMFVLGGWNSSGSLDRLENGNHTFQLTPPGRWTETYMYLYRCTRSVLGRAPCPRQPAFHNAQTATVFFMTWRQTALMHWFVKKKCNMNTTQSLNVKFIQTLSSQNIIIIVLQQCPK